MPEFASQTSGSLAARARLRPAASRHPIGEGPVYVGVIWVAAMVVCVPVVGGGALGFVGCLLPAVGGLAETLCVVELVVEVLDDVAGDWLAAVDVCVRVA